MPHNLTGTEENHSWVIIRSHGHEWSEQLMPGQVVRICRSWVQQKGVVSSETRANLGSWVVSSIKRGVEESEWERPTPGQVVRKTVTLYLSWIEKGAESSVRAKLILTLEWWVQSWAHNIWCNAWDARDRGAANRHNYGRPGAKALKISQIWKSLLRAHVENIFMKELEGEQRHSWSDLSILEQLRWKVKSLDGAEHWKVVVDTEKLEVLVMPAIHKRPGVKAFKISPRELQMLNLPNHRLKVMVDTMKLKVL